MKRLWLPFCLLLIIAVLVTWFWLQRPVVDFYGIPLGAHKTKVDDYSKYKNTGYRNWGKPEEGYTYNFNWNDSNYFLALDNVIEGIAISRQVGKEKLEEIIDELTQKWGAPIVDNRIEQDENFKLGYYSLTFSTQDEMLYKLYLRWHHYHLDDNDLVYTIVVRTKRLEDYVKASQDAYDYLFQ